MWTLAEGGDPRAIAEFESRFPQLRPELARRVSIVKSMRDARPTVAGVAPAFRLRANPIRSGPPKLRLVAGGLGLVALAAASYVVTGSTLNRHSASVKNEPTVRIVP